jgi:hypothetical protein
MTKLNHANAERATRSPHPHPHYEEVYHPSDDGPVADDYKPRSYTAPERCQGCGRGRSDGPKAGWRWVGGSHLYCPDCRQDGRIYEWVEDWSPKLIIDAIREWEAMHGRPPRAADWARPDYGQKGKRPTGHLVKMLFGSWCAGIEAAGFDCHKGPRTVRDR